MQLIDFEVAKAFFGYQYASRFHSFDQLEDVTVAGKGMNQNAFTLALKFLRQAVHLKLLQIMASAKLNQLTESL